MSWIMELAIALCMLTVAGGFSVYLMHPRKGSRSMTDTVLSLAILVGIGFLIWAYATDQWIWAPEPTNVVVDASMDDRVQALATKQAELAAATKKLETIAQQLSSVEPSFGFGLVIEIAIAICLIVIVGGTVSYVHERLRKLAKGVKPDRAEKIESRLEALEKRITDIQDVVISMDDKLDIGRPKA